MFKKNKNNKSRKAPENFLEKDRNTNNYNKPVFLILILLIGLIPGLLNLSFEAQDNYDLGSYYTGISSLVRYVGNLEYPNIYSDLHFGFFNAYYPLAHFIPAILTLVTGNIFFAISLTAILVSLFSASSFYIICKYEKINPLCSIILTFLYTYSIYFLSLLKGNISWAGAFIFTPFVLYSLYKTFNGEKKFEIILIVSAVGLILITLGAFVYIVYFFIIYIFILSISGRKFQNIINGIRNLIPSFLFVLGISSFYLFFIASINNQMAFDKLLLTPTFSGNPEMFSVRGIDFKSLFYATDNSTTLGFLPIALFILSMYLKPFSKLSDFDRYLLLMLLLSILISIYPIIFKYLPVVQNSEFGFRSLVIGAFSLIFLCRYALTDLIRKRPYFMVIGIIILGTALQLYFTPASVYKNEKIAYSDDMKDFYSIIQAEKGVVRVNYPVTLFYPLCDNCISFGAPLNIYAITRDQQTTNLWGYIDFAQRNPADIKVSGLLGEKYLITNKELSSRYIDKGYIVQRDGEILSLLENPYSSSVLQFVSDNVSTDLGVNRRGSTFKTDFEAENDGALLIKFAYHPLAEVLDNGKNVDIKETNYGIMYVDLKKGYHNVVFRYGTYNYYYISVLSILSLLFYYRKNIINKLMALKKVTS